MRLFIEHDTHYRYADAPKHLIQLLRLTPRTDNHQRVIEWRISSPGQQHAFADAFGNLTHTHVVSQPKSELSIKVRGVIETLPLQQGVLIEASHELGIPTLAFLVPTALTESFAELDRFAHHTLPNGLHRAADALSLADKICRTIEYKSGKTDVTSTAQQAFEMASGVCQDHAHIMIAACRALGVPARYVSGYVDSGNDLGASQNAAASHAWVDVYLAQNQTWVSVDVTNGIYASEAHCRLAIGRDYLDACPIRGIRAGGQTEQLDVAVSVTVVPNMQQ